MRVLCECVRACSVLVLWCCVYGSRRVCLTCSLVAGNFYDLPRRRTKSAKPATPEESTGEGSDEEDASESDEEEGEVKSTIVP